MNKIKCYSYARESTRVRLPGVRACSIDLEGLYIGCQLFPNILLPRLKLVVSMGKATNFNPRPGHGFRTRRLIERKTIAGKKYIVWPCFCHEPACNAGVAVELDKAKKLLAFWEKARKARGSKATPA